ncbi:TRAP transporter substrate-binding protein [Pararhodospirillum photometricum]|uniref:Bacterial extracellular solute-binding protein,family 7 n=1 Tax=Pararhodospirillum photometricum DSM 122 TaxID=1150469 RepID=H6SQ23_PARPM|nr:TRAP transporter substrate-binding protein [Pararhodospirillum photometricum]CCG07293.1 Bacterial extracellular solute-binding protein,family 7 [Pararhodospirillum photometricum DSM 122]
MKHCAVLAVIVVLLGGGVGLAREESRLETLGVGCLGQGDSALHRVVHSFIADVALRLSDALTLEDRCTTALGNEGDLWQAVRLGAMDLAVQTTSGLVPFVPELGILDIPYLFRDAGHAGRVLDGPVGELLAARLRDQGVVVLGFFEQGLRHITTRHRPVREPSDLKGLTLRIVPTPVFETMFRSLGAEVVTLNWGSLYTALRDGWVEGHDNAVLTLSAFHLNEVQSVVSLTGHVRSQGVILINSELFSGLSGAKRAALLAAARTAGQHSRENQEMRDAAILATFKANGMDVVTVDRQAFAHALAPLEGEWERRFGRDILHLIRETP